MLLSYDYVNIISSQIGFASKCGTFFSGLDDSLSLTAVVLVKGKGLPFPHPAQGVSNPLRPNR